jgi:hypothetical protein
VAIPSMYMAYADESGDDGRNGSPLFILTTIYFHHTFWKSNYEIIRMFRKRIRDQYGFLQSYEFHAERFINDKKPFHGLFTNQQRKEILYEFFRLIPTLKVRIINSAINKAKISYGNYPILENALKYNIQRIENDLNTFISKPKFIMITDEGRLPSMRKTARKIQRVNYLKSHFGGSYRKEIENLIEDILPKESSQSPFIQIADAVSYIVNLYIKRNICHPQLGWAGRTLNVLEYSDEVELLNTIKGKLNLSANPSNEFGIVCYPK